MATKAIASVLLSGLGVELTNGPEGFRVWAFLPTENSDADKVCVEVSRCLSDEEFESLTQEWHDQNENPDDCDIFEVAQDLYDALKVAVDALNQIPNTRLSGERRNSYAVASHLDAVLRRYKERI